MAMLSVNVNKLATLRNSRGGNNPDVLEWVKKIVSIGVQGITVHPRPDERHITQEDTFAIARWVHDHNKANPSAKVEFNIEGYPDKRFMSLIEETHPHQATLVPDPPEVLTSNAGWRLQENHSLLEIRNEALKEMGTRVSLFVDVFKLDRYELESLKDLKPDRVELYTESYASAFATSQQKEILNTYVQASTSVTELGIEINAGHDLDQTNLKTLIESIPQIKEVSIGHALICEALEEGMESTVKKYLALLK